MFHKSCHYMERKKTKMLNEITKEVPLCRSYQPKFHITNQNSRMSIIQTWFTSKFPMELGAKISKTVIKNIAVPSQTKMANNLKI